MPRQLPSDRDLVAHAIARCWLVRTGPVAAEFYTAAAADGHLNYKNIRKRGRLLSTEEKKARGIMFRGQMSAEFADTLSEAGVADPAEAAVTICFYINRLIASKRQLEQAEVAGVKQIQFRASSMLAGPCPKAAMLEEKRLPIEQVELVPFDECTHPGQCACILQAWVPLMDELDGEPVIVGEDAPAPGPKAHAATAAGPNIWRRLVRCFRPK